MFTISKRFCWFWHKIDENVLINRDKFCFHWLRYFLLFHSFSLRGFISQTKDENMIHLCAYHLTHSRFCSCWFAHTCKIHHANKSKPKKIIEWKFRYTLKMKRNFFSRPFASRQCQTIFIQKLDKEKLSDVWHRLSWMFSMFEFERYILSICCVGMRKFHNNISQEMTDTK